MRLRLDVSTSLRYAQHDEQGVGACGNELLEYEAQAPGSFVGRARGAAQDDEREIKKHYKTRLYADNRLIGGFLFVLWAGKRKKVAVVY